jgi:hypothetical protein
MMFGAVVCLRLPRAFRLFFVVLPVVASPPLLREFTMVALEEMMNTQCKKSFTRLFNHNNALFSFCGAARCELADPEISSLFFSPNTLNIQIFIPYKSPRESKRSNSHKINTANPSPTKWQTCKYLSLSSD